MLLILSGPVVHIDETPSVYSMLCLRTQVLCKDVLRMLLLLHHSLSSKWIVWMMHSWFLGMSKGIITLLRLELQLHAYLLAETFNEEHIEDPLWQIYSSASLKVITRTKQHFLASNNAAYFKNIKILNSPRGLKSSIMTLYLVRQDEEWVRVCTSARIIRISRYVLRLNSSWGC